MVSSSVSSTHNRTKAHTNSQRLWEHIQNFHYFKPDGVPTLKRENIHGNYLHLRPTSKEQNSFLQWSVNDYVNHFHGQALSSGTVGQNKIMSMLYRYFCGLFVLFCYVWALFLF